MIAELSKSRNRRANSHFSAGLSEYYCVYYSPKSDMIALPSRSGWYVVDLVWGVVMRKEFFSAEQECDARIAIFKKRDPEFEGYCWHIGADVGR
jgi:hypothetical protein